MVNEWSGGRMRRWAVALALAACALTVRGLVEDMAHARCAPEVTDRCQDTVEVEKFIIDGKEHFMKYQEGGMCSMNCIHTKLDDVAWPRFPRLVNCSLMTLAHCAPPANTSYIEALRALNMSVSNGLLLMYMPVDAHVTELSLRNAPPDLKISTAEGDGVLELQPRALAKSVLLRKLSLVRVRANALPPFLDTLSLTNTSVEVLPMLALSVKGLTIEEPKLVTLTGPATRLKKLTLNAPALESLTIYDAKLQVLSAGFAERLGRLHALSFEMVTGRVPAGFLRGATQLRTFKAIACEFTELPPDLFHYSLKLEHIDLSRNRLYSLPLGLFTGLKQLESLLLTNNRLSPSSMVVLSPLVWLKELGLSGNPLGDLCSSGHLSPLSQLQQLTALHLAHTGLSYFCRDWLTEMRALAELDLRHNNINQLVCRDLRVLRSISVSAPRIDLTGNKVMRAFCLRGDYMTAISDPIDTQGVTIVLSSVLECNCGKEWLELVLGERNLVMETPYGPEYCNVDYIRSLSCEDLLKIRGDD